MLKLLLQWSWLLLSYSPTFWCAVLETGNDFENHLSRFDKWFLEALDHNPLGKRTPCCAMSQAVPADLNWNQARCGKGKLGQPVWAVNFVTAKRQAPSCCHFLSQFQGLVIFYRFWNVRLSSKWWRRKTLKRTAKTWESQFCWMKFPLEAQPIFGGKLAVNFRRCTCFSRI